MTPATSRLSRFALACRRALVLVLLAASGLLSSCKLLSEVLISPEEEAKLGAEAYQQTLSESKISTSKAYNDLVRRAGMRIVQATGRTDLQWEFNVIDDDKTVNAFALPGGKVAVYTGIIKLVNGDEALLATVMGHEIAHVTERHGAQRMTGSILQNLGAAAIQVALESKDPQTVNAVLGVYGIGSNVLGALPFSRKHESEADHQGLIFMARAGYDPKMAVEFWKHMAAGSGGGGGFEFLSTHPSHETRIQDLESWQDEARAEYKPVTAMR